MTQTIDVIDEKDSDSASSDGDSLVLFEVFDPLSVEEKKKKTPAKKIWCCILPPCLGAENDEDDDEDDPPSNLPIDTELPPPCMSSLSSFHHEVDVVEPPRGRRFGSSKGILKRGGSVIAYLSGEKAYNAATRRSILPTSYIEKGHGDKGTKRLRFAPFTRRVNVKSHHSMTEPEKSRIWWQKSDYDGFKRGNDIITKSIKEGGSEIWLGGESNIQKPKEKESSNGGDRKWWHRYGHSRRGLEQNASGEEAQQRQRNVKMAMFAVLEEQKRQKMVGKVSAEKLARVAREYTAWAKDLALAAGESDADAVQSGFVESRKSREFFLLKHTLASECAVAPHTPAFMVPTGMHAKVLDANTSSNVLYRKRLQKQLEKQHKAMHAKLLQTSRTNEESQTESAVVDAKREAKSAVQSREKMSKKAAGFGGGGEKVNMAVLMSTYNSSKDVG